MEPKSTPAGEEQHKEPYIRERIMPKRDWKHYGMMGVLAIVSAAVMGISVGVGITIASPLIQKNVKDPSQDTSLQTEIHTTEDETETKQTESPAQSTEETEHMGTDPQDENLAEQIEQAVNRVLNQHVTDKNDLGSYSNAVKTLYAQTNTKLMPILVTGDSQTGYQQSIIYGLVLEMNGAHLTVLLQEAQLPKRGTMTIEMEEGSYPLVPISQDRGTGLVLLSADLSGADLSSLGEITAVTFGASGRLESGDLIIAAYDGTNAIGMINGTDVDITFADMHCQILYTDIQTRDTANASGFLFDLDSNVVGVIIPNQTGNQVTSYGIDDLKAVVEKLEVGGSIAYLGIQGQDISRAFAEANGLVEGIYIKSVVPDTPAYQAGLQNGDIIVAIEAVPCKTVNDMTAILYEQPENAQITVSIMRWGRAEYKQILLPVTVTGRTQNW